MSARLVALLAGVGFFFLALITQGVLPFLEPSARNELVTAVVRNDLGELDWMVKRATDYTPLEERGRRVYLREGCWYCHSQYVRPVTGETRRWGPVSEAGEYAFDVPHLWGTRRIGPDLTRVGLKYGDEWHLAHFWNPRMLTPDSVMASYRGLFDTPSAPVKIVTTGGNRTLDKDPTTERYFNFSSKEQVTLTPNPAGLLFVPMTARGKLPIILTPNKEFTGDTVHLAVETPDLQALIAYVQKLGTNRGKWRDVFEPEALAVSDMSLPRSPEWIAYGKNVYERRCLGCHGEKGDGNGPAATFMYIQRPRNFTQGEFKFRLAKGPLPTDGDLLRTITRGVRGTAMPPWYQLPLTDRLAVIQYIKYDLAVDRLHHPKPYAWFVEQPPGAPLYIGPPPAPTHDLIAHGHDVWQNNGCWVCHGTSANGQGVTMNLTDDAGFPIHPANLAGGRLKSGPRAEDIFRTVSTGLSGTPMPPFEDVIPEPDRWALAYYVLSLSAFKDPVNLTPIKVSDADRAALDDPKEGALAEQESTAYIPQALKAMVGPESVND